jgi:hypothetical protein
MKYSNLGHYTDIYKTGYRKGLIPSRYLNCVTTIYKAGMLPTTPVRSIIGRYKWMIMGCVMVERGMGRLFLYTSCSHTPSELF